MRDFTNPPRTRSPGGVYGIDYDAWGKDEPALKMQDNGVEDTRDVRDPVEIGDLSADYRGDMQALAAMGEPTMPFHEWLDANL